MGRPRGFLEIRRAKGDARPIETRLGDWAEVDAALPEPVLRDQAARCMDCGVPFCHAGCPLGNLIPEWNDLVLQGRSREAAAALHATNNFPEVTGRVCPAPCEASCVLNLDAPDAPDRAAPVTIKSIERSIADKALADGGFAPQPPTRRTGRSVAIVGSGPAGLAAAQQLARAGHDVVVFERSDQLGGLLREGIPDFKLDKRLLDLRIDQLRAEGVSFRTSVSVGTDLPFDTLRREFDATLLCIGAGRPRDLQVPGREARGVHFAMAFLSAQNRRGQRLSCDEDLVATGRHVVILGGGDTGSDCVGTSLRQHARSVTSLEIVARPPDHRAAENPWPEWPVVFRTSSSHEEGGARAFGVMTTEVLSDADGHVRALAVTDVRRSPEGALRPVEGTAREIPCDLLLLAMGFVGPETALPAALGLALTPSGAIAVRDHQTSVAGVFAAGDAARGQSLVVWAIAEGRRAADAIDRTLRATTRR